MSWWWKCGSKSSYSINWQVPRLSHRSKYFLLWSRVGTTWRQLVPSSIKAILYHCCCYMHLIQLCWGFSSCIRVYVLALYFILLFILLFFNFIVIHKCLTILFLYDYVCSMYLNYIHFSINPLWGFTAHTWVRKLTSHSNTFSPPNHQLGNRSTTMTLCHNHQQIMLVYYVVFLAVLNM